jgi:hypothetical protein
MAIFYASRQKQICQLPSAHFFTFCFFIRDMPKVRERQQQNPELDDIIKKNLQKSTLAFTGVNAQN